MPAFNGRYLQQQIRGILFFIQLHILMYLLFLRRPQQPPQAAPPPPAIHRPRRRHNMWVRPWLLQREERGGYHNIMAELYATDIPGFTNFMRMTPEFFEMIKTRLEPRLARQATNYRAPISVGEKLAHDDDVPGDDVPPSYVCRGNISGCSFTNSTMAISWLSVNVAQTLALLAA